MGALANRVWETSTTIGTGPISLAGAPPSYRTVVAGHGNGSVVEYMIEHTTAAEWEYGEGVVTDGSPDTLSRVTVWASSNGGALVNFSAGMKNVGCSPPAELFPLTNIANVWTEAQRFQRGSTTALFGADSGLTTLTDGIDKVVRMGLPSYTNAEEPVTLIYGTATGANNILNLGGGTGAFNAATSIRLYTAATIDTTTGTLAVVIDGSQNLLIGGAVSAGASGSGVLGIKIVTEPTTAPADLIQLYAKNSSLGSANATLAIRTEQAVEAIGTFTPSHKLRMWINGAEYHIQLDAV